MKIEIIALFLLLSFTNIFAFEYHLKLSQSDLQEIIEKKFPYEKKKFMSAFKVFNPVVMLRDNSEKLFIAGDISMNLLEKFDFNTSTLLSGILKFDNKTNDFYLHDFKVEKIDLKDIPKEVKSFAIENLEKLVQYQFKKEPIYHLDKKTLGSVASKLDIKKIKVKNKNMIITLEVF